MTDNTRELRLPEVLAGPEAGRGQPWTVHQLGAMTMHKLNDQQYRQGDVLIVPAKSIPADAAELPREGGAVVLAHGEVTGHSHAFRLPGPTLFRDDGAGGARFLAVPPGSPSPLTHEEHTAAPVAPGRYRVLQQFEHTPRGLREVAD